MLNIITIHGRLTNEPTLRTTQSGVSVCNFTVAVERSYVNGEDRQANFFDVVAWRGLGDVICKCFSKGKEIVIHGQMQSRKWSDKDGNMRTSWEIKADGFDFCGSAPKSNVSTTENTFIGEEREATADEDLPFILP